MSSNPTIQKQLEQQNASTKSRQKIGIQNSLLLPHTQIIPDEYSVVKMEADYQIDAKNVSDVLSYIAESLSKDELKILISYLKQKQPILNRTLPILERKPKMYQLAVSRQTLPKYPTAQDITIRQQQFQQKQDDLFGKMNIRGESVLEYDITEIPSTEKREILTPDQELEKEQLRQKQLQELEGLYGNMTILGDSILEYNLREVTRNRPEKLQAHIKREVLTVEEKEERDQLRQVQLQEQEDLYDQMDLLGEAILEFSPKQSSTAFQKYEHDDTDASNAHTIISIPSETTPQTSSGLRRTSKYLTPEQVAQLAKIRKTRYEQQNREYLENELLGESVPIELKDKYSFRRPNARLQSPREMVFRKSIVNVKKNKEKHSKTLALPVMNFPPTNWPTPIIPEIRQEMDKLRQEQRQYFLSMQQAQAQHKLLNANLVQDQNQDQDQDQKRKSILQQAQNLKSTRNQTENVRQDQNKHQRNLIYSGDEGCLSSREDRHKFIKYVYIILFVQWALITAIVSLFKYYEPALLWLEETGNWTWLYILCILNVIVISFIVFPATRKKYPLNLMMLTLYIILIAFMFSFIEIYYPNDAVLLALGCTCSICLALGLFFLQIRYNFTIYYGLILCFIICLIVLGIFYLLIDPIILDIVYAAIGVGFYSIYLVYDTRAIVKEENKFQIDFDNYILGAIHLNLDFVFITVNKIWS